MDLFAVIYTYATGSADVRDANGSAHVTFLRRLHEAGTVELAGPLNPKDISGGIVFVRAGSEAEVVEILDRDPFWEIGAVAERSVSQFEVVIGGAM